MSISRIPYLAAGALLFAFGCGPSVQWSPVPVPDQAMAIAPLASPGAAGEDDGNEAASEGTNLTTKIAQFTPAVITADLASLSANERAVLDKLIAAAKLLDPVFLRQAYGRNPEILAQLQADQSEIGQQKLAFFRIMAGPWDRQDHLKAFATDRPRPPGAGFYPEDIDEDKLNTYLSAHPEQREQILGLYTMVQWDRAQPQKLVAVPYSKAFAQWLVPAAELLREAAALTTNASLRKFLRSRASAFSTDDYFASDMDWMDLASPVEITIGPYEVYEDKLKSAKASFEAFITVTDPAASQRLAKYKTMLGAMEANLPIPENVKTKRGRKSPIRVVDLVFTSGDARTSVQTIAFNLPNDERVRAQKGSKKVMLRNLIAKKFEMILEPIAKRIIDEGQTALLSAEAFFNQVLFHELSHSLGPAYTKQAGKQVDVRQALESTYSAVEECKADTLGAYNLLYMIERKQFPEAFRAKLLLSYFAGLFRSVRFGVAAAHGKGAAIQINRYLAAGGASFDGAAGRFRVDTDKLQKAIRQLAHDLLMIQHRGDKQAAQALLDQYGVMSPAMTQALASVRDVPVDLRPIYPAAGEKP